MRLLTIISIFIISTSLFAQDYTDVLKYSQMQYQGTARFLSMGGAFGSLGGDYSAIGINPAGIATYRSSEFTFSPSLIINSTDGKVNDAGFKMNTGKTVFTIGQLAYVSTFRPMRDVKKGIVSTHFAIGYNRNNNFNFKSISSVKNYPNSMTDLFLLNLSNGGDYKTDLANQTFITPWVEDKTDPKGGYYINNLDDSETVDQTRRLEKSGNSNSITISTGINISNILQLGVSMDFNLLDYQEDTYYNEAFSPENGKPSFPDVFSKYQVHDYLSTTGSGFSLKAGFILRPLPFLRIGGAIHSPTWYNIKEDYGTSIDADFFNHKSESDQKDLYTDYKFNTPLKAIASASVIIKKLAIVSFDYTYMDYSTAKFKSNTNNADDVNYIKDINKNISDAYTKTNNFRAGVEFRINPQLSLRGGYAFQDSPFKSSPFDNKVTSISGGLGYRISNLFVDLAYVNRQYSFSQYSYNWDSSNDANLGNPPNNFYDATNHYATMTVGYKF